jgi:hypothetical protein
VSSIAVGKVSHLPPRTVSKSCRSLHGPEKDANFPPTPGTGSMGKLTANFRSMEAVTSRVRSTSEGDFRTSVHRKVSPSCVVGPSSMTPSRSLPLRNTRGAGLAPGYRISTPAGALSAERATTVDSDS